MNLGDLKNLILLNILKKIDDQSRGRPLKVLHELLHIFKKKVTTEVVNIQKQISYLLMELYKAKRFSTPSNPTNIDDKGRDLQKNKSLLSVEGEIGDPR